MSLYPQPEAISMHSLLIDPPPSKGINLFKSSMCDGLAESNNNLDNSSLLAFNRSRLTIVCIGNDIMHLECCIVCLCSVFSLPGEVTFILFYIIFTNIRWPVSNRSWWNQSWFRMPSGKLSRSSCSAIQWC